jgi:hypothetical protein
VGVAEVALGGEVASLDVVGEVGDGQPPEVVKGDPAGPGQQLLERRRAGLGEGQHRVVRPVRLQPDLGGGLVAVQQPRQAQQPLGLGGEQALAAGLALGGGAAPERKPALRQRDLGVLGQPGAQRGRVGQRPVHRRWDAARCARRVKTSLPGFSFLVACDREAEGVAVGAAVTGQQVLEGGAELVEERLPLLGLEADLPGDAQRRQLAGCPVEPGEVGLDLLNQVEQVAKAQLVLGAAVADGADQPW